MEKEKTFTNEAWHSIFGMGIQDNEVNCSSQELLNGFLNNNCVNLNDQNNNNIFESGMSSIVSSPANSHPGIQFRGGNENVVLKELIGRLGSICNSSEISALNSPPKVNMSMIDDQFHGNSIPGNHQFSHLMESRKLSRVSSNQSFKTGGSQIVKLQEENKKLSKLSMEVGDSMEESSVSETGTGIKGHNINGRKRKEKDDKVVAEDEKEESDAKRSKSNDGKKSSEKSTEPPKDYIHVRARRGQATDSHSLAERVRREKISERMKFLQDLVPGCNKVTGKAVMLDEIINYVQSLQRQVEFLSMKLATVNPRMDASMEALLSKDMFQVSLPNNVNPFDASIQSFPYGLQSQVNRIIHDEPENQFSMNPFMAAVRRNSIIKPSHIDGFGEASTFWENDLQSVVKMALGQDQPRGFFGQMKVEL